MTLFDDTDRTAASPAGPPGDQQRVRLLVAYDGSAFHGFAVNRGVPTVAGTLQQALSMILQVPVDLTGAGRTDRGVHAWGQVVTFDAPAPAMAMPELRHALNRVCGPAIVVRDATVVAADFDAR